MQSTKAQNDTKNASPLLIENLKLICWKFACSPFVLTAAKDRKNRQGSHVWCGSRAIDAAVYWRSMTVECTEQGEVG